MNPILDRIRKLLRLAKDRAATAAEAAAAMAKAIELAESNGIDIQAIKFVENSDHGLSHVTEPSQCGPAHRLASSIVRDHFGVDTLFDSRGRQAVIHFIGSEINCQLASYVYIYLVRSMRAAWRKRENRRLRDRDAFLHGYAQAVRRLMPTAFRNEGLIMSCKAYRDTVILGGSGAKVTSVSSPKLKSTRAFTDGLSAGKRDGIRNPIAGASSPARLG